VAFARARLVNLERPKRPEAESSRGAALVRLAANLRASRTRDDLFAIVVRDVRAIFDASRVALYRADLLDASVVLTVAEAGRPGAVSPARRPPGGRIERSLTSGELVRLGDLELIAPVWVEGRVDLAIAVQFDVPRAFDEVDLVMMRGIATQIELALESRRLAEADQLRRTRADSLERTMLALREPREARDILAIVAHGLAHDLRRPCVAYELQGVAFVATVGAGTTGDREPIALDRFEIDLLVTGSLRHDGVRDIAGITANGQLRALLILEEARGPLSEDDTNYVRAIGTHAGLALAGAIAFDQLRRYATEGAALKEAARTILGFTEVRPLAVALSRLGARLVRAPQAAIYAESGGDLVLLGAASDAFAPHADERLITGPDGVALPPGGALALFAERYAGEPYVAEPLALTGDDAGAAGYLVVRRPGGAPFERYERRMVVALVNLARLALRNVDLYERSDRANRALAESNAFKDDLLAMFAHDFKGPLTVISGFSELLLETSEDPEVRSTMGTITEQTGRLARLAEDALALAATQSAGFSLQRERADLGAFVYECGSVLDPEGRRLAFDLPEVPVAVLFDRTRLRHVIDNVVGNALKYSTGVIDVAVAPDGAGASIAVTDRGIGIPAAEIEAVFTRYGRASNARSRGVAGSGVGLYIAKKIVDVHGGTLVVASVENRGSTFRIALPG